MLTNQDIRELVSMMHEFGLTCLEVEQPNQRIRLDVSPNQVTASEPLQIKDVARVQPEFVTASSIGIFRRNHPDGVYVGGDVGSIVQPSQILAFLEINGLLFPVLARRSGRISKVLAADGDLIGYGTPLFEIDQAAP